MAQLTSHYLVHRIYQLCQCVIPPFPRPSLIIRKAFSSLPTSISGSSHYFREMCLPPPRLGNRA